MSNTNIKLDSKDLGRAALAWQSPQLVSTVGHEARSMVWMGVILLALGSVVFYALSRPQHVGPTNQEISDYRQLMLRQCVSTLVAQGYVQYTNNNCDAVANAHTYNRYGRMPY